MGRVGRPGSHGVQMGSSLHLQGTACKELLRNHQLPSRKTVTAQGLKAQGTGATGSCHFSYSLTPEHSGRQFVWGLVGSQSRVHTGCCTEQECKGYSLSVFGPEYKEALGNHHSILTHKMLTKPKVSSFLDPSKKQGGRWITFCSNVVTTVFVPIDSYAYTDLFSS